MNAAICLERLGRYDEAFELYHEVVARFASDLAPEDRENLAPVIASLGAKIGHLELSANAAGAVTVGGRARGVLPFSTALPVMPGPQTIRISKAGYETFESTVELQAGETQRLDAHLHPLSARPGTSFADAQSASSGPRARLTRLKPARFQLEVGANLGGIYAPRTRAGLEAYCPDFCGRDRGVLGAQAELSIAVRHRSGFAAELAGGGQLAIRQPDFGHRAPSRTYLDRARARRLVLSHDGLERGRARARSWPPVLRFDSKCARLLVAGAGARAQPW